MFSGEVGFLVFCHMFCVFINENGKTNSQVPQSPWLLCEPHSTEEKQHQKEQKMREMKHGTRSRWGMDPGAVSSEAMASKSLLLATLEGRHIRSPNLWVSEEEKEFGQNLLLGPSLMLL